MLVVSIGIIDGPKELDFLVSEGVHFIGLGTNVPDNILEFLDADSPFRNALCGALLEIEDTLRSHKVTRGQIVVNRNIRRT